MLEKRISEMPRPEIPNLTKIFYFENITWRGTQIIDVS